MDKVISYPIEVFEHFNVFKDCFSRPQFENFCNYEVGLVMGGKRTVDRISQIPVHCKHQSSLNRFLTESPWNVELIHSVAFDHVVKSCVLPPFPMFIIDDTFIRKYGVCMSGVGYHRDCLDGKKKLGHSVVTSGFWTNKGLVPFKPKLYIRKTDLEEGDNFFTKNEFACQLINEAGKHKKAFLFGFDSWYTNKIVVNCVKSKNAFYVGEIRSNRNITVNRRKQHAKEYFEKLKDKDFTILEVDFPSIEEKLSGTTYRYHQTTAYNRDLKQMNLVITQLWNKDEEKWEDPYYIVTNSLRTEATTVIHWFLKRNTIEGFHRESKQQTGLKDYQMQKNRGIVRHLYLVFIAYIILMLIMFDSQTKRKTISKTCKKIKNLCTDIILTQLLNTKTKKDRIKLKEKILNQN